MLNWLRAGLVGLMLVVGASGCASSPAGAESLAAIVAPSGDEPVVVRSVPEYRLGAADKVRVNVFA